ncbi:hypothetical protein AB0I77_05400 [Streptomyces sp. NPDC050619]|uniref:hypothetical protein n=1 Tax=Streptomyces sp. NPDC050619 TaxID=3157214 RepID=UPI00341C36F9
MEENIGANPTGATEPRVPSRRRMLGMSGAAGLAAVGALGAARLPDEISGPGKDAEPSQVAARVTAPPPDGVLGANFNGAPNEMLFAELEDLSATWVRGFFPMPNADQGPIAEKPQIEKLLTAGELGYGTVLSLKFPYKKNPIPTPGSDAWMTAFARLERVLPVVMNKVDILVIGNEPFVESQSQDRDERLNEFYEQLAQRVIAYRDSSSATRTKLYMGALNHRAAWRTDATNRWLRFVNRTLAIDGVDIHPHLAAPGGAQKYLEYVLPLMRPEQKFLATEFSLVHLWGDHLTDPVSAEFAKCHPEEGGKLVWEVLRGATQQRFTQQKWDDFLSKSPWFESNKTYLQDQVEKFRSSKRLAVATYGVSQDEAMATGFTEKSVPWILNSLFCPYTVQGGEDGLPGRNRTWINQFRALQST